MEKNNLYNIKFFGVVREQFNPFVVIEMNGC